MLTGAAFVPHPPSLVPDLARGAAGELGALRGACGRAITHLFAGAPDLLLLLGRDVRTRRYPHDVSGSLAPYGLDQRFHLGRGGDPELPLSLTVGAHLLALTKTDTVAYGVGDTPLPPDVARLVAEWRVGLIVLGDGSARRSISAPGYLDDRAAGFDADVAATLASGDAHALGTVDVGLGDDLLAAGPRVWRAAAGLMTHDMNAELLYDEAPYGVGYFVAAWTMP